MQELKKPLPSYEGLYDITSTGRIWSWRMHKWMRPSITPAGYFHITLIKDGERKSYDVHRLTALAFLPNPKGLSDVNHKDGQRLNNTVFVTSYGTVDEERSNLEWCTRQYNLEHAYARKSFQIGIGNPSNPPTMKNRLHVTFYCREQNVRNGKAPVEVCINVSGKRTVFRIEEYYAPSEFKRKRESTRSNDVKELCAGIQAKFAEIRRRFPGLSSDEYKRYYVEGLPLERNSDMTVASLCREYLETVVKGRPSYRHYQNTFNVFEGSYGNVRVLDVNSGDIRRFIDSLEFAEGTKRNYFKRLKSLFDYAFQKRYAEHHPFAGLKMQFKDPEPVYLTPEEMNRIAWLGLGPRLARARDLFLFMAGSGTEYSDAMELGPDDVKEKDGIWYIQKKRVKTGVEYTAVLINHALDVWKTYEGLLPQISNQVLNRFLKEIATMAGITDKNVTSLTARHVYATSLLSGTYTLPGREDTKPITIDVLRRCLGHTHMTQSLRYATLLDESLFDAFGPSEKARPAGLSSGSE